MNPDETAYLQERAEAWFTAQSPARGVAPQPAARRGGRRSLPSAATALLPPPAVATEPAATRGPHRHPVAHRQAAAAGVVHRLRDQRRDALGVRRLRLPDPGRTGLRP